MDSHVAYKDAEIGKSMEMGTILIILVQVKKKKKTKKGMFLWFKKINNDLLT
jgi:hypothetical protein